MIANPVAALLTEVRHAVLDPSAPSAAAAAGGYPILLIPLAIVFAVLALGIFVFRRESLGAAELV